MNESINSKMFDLLLETAFSKYEEKLNSDIPSDEELAQRFPLPREEIRSVLKYQKKAEKIKKYGKPLGVIYLRRAVAIVLIAVTVLFGATMLNGEVRAAVGKAIVQFFEKYVKIIPSNNSDGTSEESDSLNIYDFEVLSNIPEGYEVINSSENNSMREFDFLNASNEYLYVCITYPNYYTVELDIENSNFEEIQIDDNEAYRQVDTTEEPNNISIIVLKKNIVLIIMGYGTSETLTEIAESIIKD